MDIELLRHFRSVTILIDRSSTGPGRAPVSQDVIGWLRAYDAWMKERAIEAGRLAYMYNRSLSLLLCDFEHDGAYVTELSREGAALGFSPLIQLSAAECLAHPSELERLLDEAQVGSLFLDASDAAALDPAVCAQLVLSLARRRSLSVILFGPMPFWLETQVLRSDELNQISFQLIPSPPELSEPMVERPPLRPGQRALKRLESVRSHLIAPHMFDPCAHRFQLFITPDGQVYPCHGLVDVAGQALAHIQDPVDDRLFRRGAELADLAARGPGLAPETGEPTEGTGLPPICRRHRRVALDKADQVMSASRIVAASVGAEGQLDVAATLRAE